MIGGKKDMSKKCIVHVPFKIDRNRPSGPNIRPLKMISAFEKIGYEVDLIEGYSDERKIQIQNLKNRILRNEKFDFIYSESSTMPTALTDRDHFPRNFNLDFNFFEYARAYGIPISLFYRDVYWKYPEYKLETSFFKRNLAINFYKYDLKKYNNTIDILYVPSLGYTNKIKNNINIKVSELPPGFDLISAGMPYESKTEDDLKLFYVGGINAMYDLKELFKVVSQLNNIKLHIVTRSSDWDAISAEYEMYLNENISITHEQGEVINKYYAWADLLMLTTKPNEYREMAVPIKLFEYIGNKKPIITYQNSYTGDYVSSKGIGYVVQHGTEELKDLLISLVKDKKQLQKFIPQLEDEAQNNTWQNRAKKVVNEMKNIKKNKVMILSDASNSHTRKWVKQTIEEGYEVVVVSLNKGNIDGCTIYDFSETDQQSRGLISKMNYLRHVRRIKNIIKKENPDIIHAHYASSYGFLAYLTGEPYYLNVWGKDVYEFPEIKFITKRILKLVLNNAKQIYSTSHVMKRVTQQYTNRDIVVTPFGIEIDVFKPRDLNKNQNEFHIGYIKLIEKKYGVEDLIDAYKMIVDKYPNQKFKLTIVGKGTLKPYLVQKVEEIEIEDQVEFIDYVNGQEKVAELYNLFDICVFPSVDDSESFGVSAVESMGSGTPTIVSDVSGFREITKEGEIALMFKRGDVQALFKHLETLYTDTDLRNDMAVTSRMHVVDNYNVKDNFKPVFKAYREELTNE